VRRAVLAVAVLAAGCGGDDTLTKEEYAAKLDAACLEFAERERRIGDPKTAADLVRFGPEIVQAFEETILDEVGSLDPPEEVAAEATQLRQLAQEQRDVLAGLVEAARERDVARLGRLAAQNRSINEQAGSIARRLGADSCAGARDQP
jgi:hypothetical protein